MREVEYVPNGRCDAVELCRNNGEVKTQYETVPQKMANKAVDDFKIYSTENKGAENESQEEVAKNANNEKGETVKEKTERFYAIRLKFRELIKKIDKITEEVTEKINGLVEEIMTTDSLGKAKEFAEAIHKVNNEKKNKIDGVISEMKELTKATLESIGGALVAPLSRRSVSDDAIRKSLEIAGLGDQYKVSDFDENEVFIPMLCSKNKDGKFELGIIGGASDFITRKRTTEVNGVLVTREEKELEETFLAMRRECKEEIFELFKAIEDNIINYQMGWTIAEVVTGMGYHEYPNGDEVAAITRVYVPPILTIDRNVVDQTVGDERSGEGGLVFLPGSVIGKCITHEDEDSFKYPKIFPSHKYPMEKILEKYYKIREVA